MLIRPENRLLILNSCKASYARSERTSPYSSPYSEAIYKNVRLEGKDPNEIKILSDFLSTDLSEQYADSAGEVRVIPSNQYKLIENLVESLPKLPVSRKFELTKQVLQSLEEIVGVTV